MPLSKATYYNVVETSVSRVYLMPVSTNLYSAACDEADSWRKRYPNRSFMVVIVTELEP
jgi:hypothetical protein